MPSRFEPSDGELQNPYTGTLVFIAGRLLLVQVSRQPGVTTALLEPALEEVWGGRRLVAVATHIGQGSARAGGHWRTYVLDGEVWWRLESLGDRRPVIENPFLHQEGHKIAMLAFMM